VKRISDYQEDKMMNKHTLLKAGAVVVLLLGFKLALAAVPSTMNYQAYLTDDMGLPIDGTADVEISIYNASVGGTALWSETRVGTTVNKGVLSVELGDSVPFPPGLFEMPLWIGVKVGTDAEMTPRRPITSTGFTFKASDADTIDGISAASLDQSAHVADMANPHNVTTAQIGAISGADLTAHAGDSSAHHVKTSSFSELSGQISDGQIPALIARDAEIMPTVLANDGSGSTLNADMVDGFHAGSFMPSAADFWVNTTGDTMTGNLTTTAKIGIGTAPSYSLDVRDGVSTYLGYFLNDNNTAGNAYGIYTSADARDTGTGSAYGARNYAYGGSTSGNAYGSRNFSAAYGSSNSYAVYADAEYGTTTGNEYAFYGYGKGYFSDNVGIGSTLANYKLTVVGSDSQFLGYFENINTEPGDVDAAGLFVLGDASDTVTGEGIGSWIWAVGGSSSGDATGVETQAIAYGSGNRSYAVYANATGGTNSANNQYAFYGLGRGYFSQDLDVNGTSYIGFERVTGAAVSLTGTTTSCGMINTGTCYYGSASAVCPTGKVAVGGGCRCNSSYNCGLIANYPVSLYGWSCSAVATSSSYTVSPYVNCARVSN
jgi:hypothetical protein